MSKPTRNIFLRNYYWIFQLDVFILSGMYSQNTNSRAEATGFIQIIQGNIFFFFMETME